MVNEKPLRRINPIQRFALPDLRLRYGGVEFLHQAVDVDAVRQSALLDVFEMRGGTADATHAGIHEDLDCVGILLDNLFDAHIFRNRHAKNLPCVKDIVDLIGVLYHVFS